MRMDPHNAMLFRLGRRWVLLAGALVSVAGAPASITITAAYAGSYHLYSCAQPNNQRAPVDGWSSQVTGPNMRQSNSCATGGFLLGAIDGGPSQPVGATVSWVFSVPWYDSIRAATIWRTYVTNGSGASAQTAAYMAAPNNAFDSLDAFDVCPAVGCGHAGVTGGPRFEPADRVIVPPSNLNGLPVSMSTPDASALLADGAQKTRTPLLRCAPRISRSLSILPRVRAPWVGRSPRPKS